MSKLIFIADNVSKESISYLGTGTNKDISDYVIVLPSQDPNFKVEHIMLSLAMQIKMRMEKEGTDIEDRDAAAAIMERIAYRASFSLEERKLMRGKNIKFIGNYSMDNGKVLIRNATKAPGYDSVLLRNIGEVHTSPLNEVKTGLYKLIKFTSL